MQRARLCSLVLGTLGLGILFPPAAAADEVVLKNGRRLSGSVRVLADERVEIATAGGELTLPATMVQRIERSIGVEQEIATRLGRAPRPDAAELFTLAEKAAGGGASTLARQLYERVIAADPDHRGARVARGFRATPQGWMSEPEYRAWRGEVSFRGQWVPSEERDRVLALELARAEAEAARAQPPSVTAVVVNVQPAPSYAPYLSPSPVPSLGSSFYSPFAPHPFVQPFPFRPKARPAPRLAPPGPVRVDGPAIPPPPRGAVRGRSLRSSRGGP